MEQPDIVVFEAPLGSDLYRQALALREAILRRPLGLTISAEELADDAARQHFCALWLGRVVGSVSLKPLGRGAAPAEADGRRPGAAAQRVGRQLLSHAEDWGRTSGFHLMVLNARLGAEGFYAAYGYLVEGEPFEENTLPHIRMTKRLG